MSSVNERLKAVRKALGLTLEKMASLIGITKGGVAQLEQPNNTVAARNILLYVLLFGVNEHWLKTGEGDMFLDRRALLHEALMRQWQLSSEDASFVVNFVFAPPERRSKIVKAHELINSWGQ